MQKAIWLVFISMITIACVPQDYAPLQASQNELRQYWQKNISDSIIQSSCIDCHDQDSIAFESDYILAAEHQGDYLDTNLARTLAYLQSSEQNKQQFLSKTTGQDHDTVLTDQSDRFTHLQTFVEMAQQQELDRHDAINFYIKKLSTELFQNQCNICHVQYGVASHSQLTLVSNREQNYKSMNANRVIDFALSSTSNFDNLFLKAIGENHAGGEVIESDSELAIEFTAFLNMLTQIDQP